MNSPKYFISIPFAESNLETLAQEIFQMHAPNSIIF